MEMFVACHNLSADIAGHGTAVRAGHLIALDEAQSGTFATVSIGVTGKFKLSYTRLLDESWSGMEHG